VENSTVLDGGDPCELSEEMVRKASEMQLLG